MTSLNFWAFIVLVIVPYALSCATFYLLGYYKGCDKAEKEQSK